MLQGGLSVFAGFWVKKGEDFVIGQIRKVFQDCFSNVLARMTLPVPLAIVKITYVFACKTCPISLKTQVMASVLLHGPLTEFLMVKCGACNID